ncbi:hypothetical protein LINGRAPRIM_LOCUS2906 [Linum grandiflorum]
MAGSLPRFLAPFVAAALIVSLSAAASVFQPISDSHRSAALEIFDRSFGRFVIRLDNPTISLLLLKGVVSRLESAASSASSLLEFYHSIGGLVLVKVTSVSLCLVTCVFREACGLSLT